MFQRERGASLGDVAYTILLRAPIIHCSFVTLCLIPVQGGNEKGRGDDRALAAVSFSAILHFSNASLVTLRTDLGYSLEAAVQYVSSTAYKEARFAAT
jgi:hypothetical protein